MDETHNAYEKTDTRGRCVGMEFEDKYAVQYLKLVSDRFYNKMQTDDEMSSMDKTGMKTGDLEKILKSGTKPAGWRIGEYIAITALEKFFDAKIYHDPNRETTSPNAILAGPDLIGTARLKSTMVFLLGETKTSSSTRYPLPIMNNLVSELEGLSKVDGERANAAIRWLILHRKDYDENAIDEASQNYQRRKITGVLVRDTHPNRNDMLPGYDKLLPSLSEDTFLLMIALYLPIKISDFDKFMVA